MGLVLWRTCLLVKEGRQVDLTGADHSTSQLNNKVEVIFFSPQMLKLSNQAIMQEGVDVFNKELQ